MFSIFGSTEARRLPGASQFPWKEILLVAIIVIALAAMGYGTNWFVSRTGENTSAPAVIPVLQQQRPVAQPVQQAPQQNVAVAPANLPLLRWEKIGEASNGDQVLTLPIPWDRLIRPATGPTNADPNREMWIWLSSLNQPDSRWGPGKGYIFGYVIEGNRVVVYGLASQDEHTGSYWKAEIPTSGVKGLRP